MDKQSAQRNSSGSNKQTAYATDGHTMKGWEQRATECYKLSDRNTCTSRELFIMSPKSRKEPTGKDFWLHPKELPL